MSSKNGFEEIDKEIKTLLDKSRDVTKTYTPILLRKLVKWLDKLLSKETIRKFTN